LCVNRTAALPPQHPPPLSLYRGDPNFASRFRCQEATVGENRSRFRCLRWSGGHAFCVNPTAAPTEAPTPAPTNN
jgi:hypothetical protein